MNNCRGKFIVLYGINNLGKTTQAKMLVDRLNSTGQKAEYLKYPVYNLEPAGKLINAYLRNGNPYNLSPRELQLLHYIDRISFESILKDKLNKGINIIAEDYFGTGVAWGIGAGVESELLKYLYSFLYKEDLVILFDGERFKDSIEKNHKHETDEELTNKVRQAHLKLGQEYGWIKINANQPIEQIHQQLWQEAIKIIKPDTKFAPDFKYLHEQNQNQKPAVHSDKKSDIRYPISDIRTHRLSPTAKLPTRAHPSDAGLDLYANDYYSLMPRERAVIQTGIKMTIPDGYVGLIWDKGGVARDGIHTIAGVVDAGFRGEVTVNLINLDYDIYNIAPGQKVAQMLIQKVEFPEIVEGEVDDQTDRGEGRFGSTGMF